MPCGKKINLKSNQTHSSKRVLSIQLFFWDLYQHGKDVTFLKHLGSFDFPIMNIRSWPPTEWAAARPVILFLPAEHFLDFKACVYFLSNLYFFTKWLPFKNYQKCFFFPLKSLFRSPDSHTFVIFSLLFHTFQIQKDKWKCNNLCHELTCINLQIQLLEKLKNCFTLYHQTRSDNI